MKVVAFFDGNCSLGKRGSGAAIVYDEDGNELARRATYIENKHVTNNVSEWCGLLNALNLAHELGARSVKVLGDSELIIRQFNRKYQVHKEHLKPWYVEATRRSKVFDQCVVQELPKCGPKNKRRYLNDQADALATACIKAGHDL